VDDSISLFGRKISPNPVFKIIGKIFGYAGGYDWGLGSALEMIMIYQ